MRLRASLLFTLPASAVLLVACQDSHPVDPLRDAASLRASRLSAGFATVTKLATLGSNSEAYSVNAAGNVVVGQSFESSGMLRAVRWTFANGAWALATLPYSSSASAHSVDDQGDAVGYGATSPRQAVFWPAAGGSIALGCPTDAGATTALAVSANGQVVVGQGAGSAALWIPDGSCRVTLPALGEGGGSIARAVSDDGTVVGGIASFTPSGDGLPVRWTLVAGVWQIEQLDARFGSVDGANAAGDLAGDVSVTCATATCAHAYVWNAGAGGAIDLGTLGEQSSNARDINASREVVGIAISSRGVGTPFFWSASKGALALPLASGRGSGSANAVSDVRADGTRLAAGTQGGVQPVVWVVRNP